MSILNLAQAAQYLNVSEKSVRRYIHAGRLPVQVVRGQKGDEYRFDSVNLDQLLKPERGRKKNSTPHTPVTKAQVDTPRTPKPYEPEKRAEETAPLSQEKHLDQIINRDFIHIRQLIDDIKEKKAATQDTRPETRTPTPEPAFVKPTETDTLYRELLAKYEDALMKIGHLEAQLRVENAQITQREEHLKRRLAEQEQLIQELYQIVRFYEA
ncbi:MAG: helix-turn-helix domain-containing protein [Patescibacteria group bacterium]